jgi:hypothetical protein
MSPESTSSAGDPAIRRNGDGSTGLLLYGLLVPPLIWAAQLYLNFGMASHACYPNEAPRTSFLPGWDRIWTVLLAVNLLCAAICAIGLLASGYSWRRLRGDRDFAEEAGGAAHLSDGRLRSFAVCGLMVSGLFTVAILFNTLYLWALSTCSQV